MNKKRDLEIIKDNLSNLIYMIYIPSIYLGVIIIILTIIFYVINKLLIIEHYAGNKFSNTLLNETLIKIVNILNKENIDEWFIGYGTLLGIIRNNSCIDDDDDIDIMININNTSKLDNIIDKYNLKILIKKHNFMKLSIDDNLPTIDFYLCDINNDGDFNDTWESCIWSNCTPIIKKDWKNIQLNMPNNPEIKLKNQYGDNWMTPIKDYKGEKRQSI